MMPTESGLSASPEGAYFMAWRDWGRRCMWGTREQCVAWLIEQTEEA